MILNKWYLSTVNHMIKVNKCVFNFTVSEIDFVKYIFVKCKLRVKRFMFEFV